MKEFIVTIFIIWLVLCPIKRGFAKRNVYFPKDKMVEFYYDNSKYSILINAFVDKIYQTVHPLDKFDPFNYLWEEFFQESIGKSKYPNKNLIVNDVVRQIIGQARKDRDLTVKLAREFVSELYRSAVPSIPRNGYIYQPYELLYIGVKTEEEAALLLGAIYSSLCLDVQLVNIEEQWHLSIFSGIKEKSGEKYFIYDNNGVPKQYKIVNLADISNGMEVKNFNSNNALLPVVDIQEQCKFIYQSWFPSYSSSSKRVIFGIAENGYRKLKIKKLVSEFDS